MDWKNLIGNKQASRLYELVRQIHYSIVTDKKEIEKIKKEVNKISDKLNSEGFNDLIIEQYVDWVDMNMLCKPQALDILRSLPINNGKKIEYEFICGIDYRFLTKEIAIEMRKHHFKRIRLAWDWFYKDQMKIRDSLKILYNVGYKPEDLILFMICNHPSISYNECLRKLDLCKVWNVKVADCYFDNQTKIFKKFIPIGWTTKQAKDFRLKVRKHNQLVLFKVDPQL